MLNRDMKFYGNCYTQYDFQQSGEQGMVVNKIVRACAYVRIWVGQKESDVLSLSNAPDRRNNISRKKGILAPIWVFHL